MSVTTLAAPRIVVTAPAPPLRLCAWEELLSLSPSNRHHPCAGHIHGSHNGTHSPIITLLSYQPAVEPTPNLHAYTVFSPRTYIHNTIVAARLSPHPPLPVFCDVDLQAEQLRVTVCTSDFQLLVCKTRLTRQASPALDATILCKNSAGNGGIRQRTDAILHIDGARKQSSITSLQQFT
jgi:hypothetical protein